MTGPIATFGQESVMGMRLALDELNKQANAESIKHKINLIVEDNKGEPVDTANAVRKLIKVDQVATILGAVGSSNTLAGAPIAQNSKVPMLTPASTSEKVTQAGNFISRTCFTDNFQGEVLAKFAFGSLSKKRAVIIVDTSSDYSKGLAQAFKDKFVALGGTVIGDDIDDYAYQQKDVEFRSLLRKVKRQKPDVIFLPGYYSEVGLILKQARQLRLSVPILGGDGWDSPNLTKLAGAKGVENTYISSHFAADDKDPVVQKFVAEYEKRYKQRPGAMAALGYDAILVLNDALKRAGSKDSLAISKAINSTKDFKGITGTISLNEARNAVKSAVILKVTMKGNLFSERVSP